MRGPKKTDPTAPVGSLTNYVRTGGAIGGSQMQEMADFDASGGGVVESIRDVGSFPNADLEQVANEPGAEE